MKKLLMALVMLTCMVVASCSSDESGSDMRGSIYGVVTVSDTAEPMRATGVELYKDDSGALLLKTVTYDDGHFEFEDLQPGYYDLRVDADGYEEEIFYVEVEAGRTARADMRLKRLNTGMTVKTDGVTAHNNGTVEFKGSYSWASYSPQECGFIYGQNRELTKENGVTVRTERDMKATVSGLEAGKWYVMAYAKNYIGYAFGSILSFEISGYPEVTTKAVTNITDNSATLNGVIDYAGNPEYTEKGFVYSSSFPNPTVDDPQSATTNVVVSGKSKDFSANIANLTTGKKYYVRAYVKNASQTVYGSTVNFVAESPKPYYVIDNLAVQLSDLSRGVNWDSAKELCEQSRVGGFSDWRLPTIGELSLIYTKKNEIGGFGTGYYWSSTLYGYSYNDYPEYKAIYFYNGNNDYQICGNSCSVRAVRTVN